MPAGETVCAEPPSIVGSPSTHDDGIPPETTSVWSSPTIVGSPNTHEERMPPGNSACSGGIVGIPRTHDDGIPPGMTVCETGWGRSAAFPGGGCWNGGCRKRPAMSLPDLAES